MTDSTKSITAKNFHGIEVSLPIQETRAELRSVMSMLLVAVANKHPRFSGVARATINVILTADSERSSRYSIGIVAGKGSQEIVDMLADIPDFFLVRQRDDGFSFTMMFPPQKAAGTYSLGSSVTFDRFEALSEDYLSKFSLSAAFSDSSPLKLFPEVPSDD